MFLSDQIKRTKPFVIGTWVYYSSIEGRFGVVYKIHNKQGPNNIKSCFDGLGVTCGTARFDIVFENGTKMLAMPESVVRGENWKLPNRPIADNHFISVLLKRFDETQNEMLKQLHGD